MPTLGIGGIFFRARDPESLSAWYRTHLGVGAGCATERAGEAIDWAWMAEGGPVIFAPFPGDTDYFPADRAFMVNLRVSDLDALLADLRTMGMEVITDPEWDQPGVGRFARIHDPEGNPIELWEPDRAGS